MQRHRTHIGTGALAFASALAFAVILGQGARAAHAQGKGKAAAKPAAPVNFKSKAKEWEVLAFDSIALVQDMQGLAPYLWAYRASCDAIENDLQKRQCQGLRALRQQQIAGKNFLVRGDRRSFRLADFDPQQKGAPLFVYACFACTGPIDAQGQVLYVTGQGEKSVFGTQILGPVIYTEALPFKTAEEAAQWKTEVGPRLRTEYVVRIPDSDVFWSASGVEGLSVEILGFRVYDPCTGKMVISQPKAKSLPRDESTCTGEDLVALQRAREEAEKPKDVDPKSKLPPKLTPQDIQKTMEPVTVEAQQCFAVYGVAGEAKFRIKISGEGKVTEIEQTGYFKDTPTGDCMEAAIRAAQFPATQKDLTAVTYPLVLR